LNKSGVKEDDLWFHDEKADSIHAFLLSRLRQPNFPEPIGVLRAVQSETFDEAMRNQVSEAIAKKGKADLQKLLNSGETWKVT
jgi:2-oxoglutarate ferredoxin oxidoreductase subunit beta